MLGLECQILIVVPVTNPNAFDVRIDIESFVGAIKQQLLKPFQQCLM